MDAYMMARRFTIFQAMSFIEYENVRGVEGHVRQMLLTVESLALQLTPAAPASED